MEKNALWAVLLSAIFLIVWYHFFQPAPVPPANPRAASSSTSDASAGKNLVAHPPLLPSDQQLKKGGTKVLQALEMEKVIERASAKIVIASRGAGVKHWWLKESAFENGVRSSHVDLVNHPDAASGNSPSPQMLPLATFPELNFQELHPSGSSGKNDQSLSVWRALLPNGIEVEKSYILEDGSENVSKTSPFLKLTLSLKNRTKRTATLENFQIGWEGGLGTVESEKKENLNLSRVLAYPSPTKEVASFKTGEHKAEYAWVGIDNRYYLFAMLPQQGQFDHILTEKSKTNPGEVKLATNKIQLAPGESKSYELKIYAGPKGYTQLKKWGLGLEHSVDFGTFGFLGKWALRAMNALRRLTGNYGWAIVILTCMLQLIVFPLSLKSYKSMAGMKKLQPKIQELQNRYKDDPKRMNQETMALYKESKTNPFGGCLPMILQIPIFYAFFTMLRNSYELRGAPWILWIKDLSQHDPYYVLPLVMGGGMFLQQKISGTSGDPTQANMMIFMPFIFTFMFLKFPSGLVLYWLTNSLLSMATQYWFTKKFSQPASGRV